MATGNEGEDRETQARGKLAGYMRYSGAGIQLCVAGALGVLLGWWLDEKTGLSPLFLILCAGLGFTAGIYTLYKELFGRKR